MKDIRARFLAKEAGRVDYWRSIDDLAAYDAFFGQRIGWKWQSVFAEINPPQLPCIVDWGCGSGVAVRTYLSQISAPFPDVYLFDRSSLAMNWTRQKLVEDFPGLNVHLGLPKHAKESLLLLSHVLSELDSQQQKSLLDFAKTFHSIIWVEDATFETSRNLASIRDLWKNDFQVLGPCTHNRACGLFEPSGARHWCHSFASVPSHIFSDASWVASAKELGIDLRSCPYSYLAVSSFAGTSRKEAQNRVIGRPRVYKGRLNLLVCDGEDGLKDWELQKRDAPTLFKDLSKSSRGPFFRFIKTPPRITGEESELK